MKGLWWKVVEEVYGGKELKGLWWKGIERSMVERS